MGINIIRERKKTSINPLLNYCEKMSSVEYYCIIVLSAYQIPSLNSWILKLHVERICTIKNMRNQNMNLSTSA